MTEKVLSLDHFYEVLRPNLERKADVCPGCKYTLELLPKLKAGKTTTDDHEQLVKVLEDAVVLCKTCQANLNQYLRGIFVPIGQVEIERMRKKMEVSNTEMDEVCQAMGFGIPTLYKNHI